MGQPVLILHSNLSLILPETSSALIDLINLVNDRLILLSLYGAETNSYGSRMIIPLRCSMERPGSLTGLTLRTGVYSLQWMLVPSLFHLSFKSIPLITGRSSITTPGRRLSWDMRSPLISHRVRSS